ncbi:MAG: lipoprotein-releasing ABC transporter permease subunit [Magnetococcales bacterium]|nr:lipoprotein-releasing ABC transporter permease subunit [Magnetococcales bacterium]
MALRGYETWIGLRYLRAKHSQHFIGFITIISIAGISLGVAALIVVLSVMTGFREELQRQILGVTSHVVVQTYDGKMDDWRTVLGKIIPLPGVAAAAPYIYSQGMLSTPSGASGVVVRGVDPALERHVSSLERNMVEGKIFDLEDFGLILGRPLARTLGVKVGDDITLMAPNTNVTAAGTMPRMKRFRVAGIFDSGMHDYDHTLAYIHLRDAQVFYRYGDRITGLEIHTADPDLAFGVRKKVEETLGFAYWVRDWMMMNRNFFNALQMEKATMFVILFLVVLVAAFNIVSTLVMVVMEKGKEIAILKTMGATGRSIMTIFVINGAVIGVAGTAAGVGLGITLAFNLEKVVALIERILGIELIHGDVYFINHLPSKVLPLDVAWVTGLSLSISLLATLYPAWRASRVDPVEALRNE